jgi:MraZ protein
MFVGESSHTLDAKHRVHVPKRFQAVLRRDEEGHRRVVVTRGFEKCLFVFSEEGFADVLARLRTQPFGGEKLRRMQRLFFSKVHSTSLDSAGRLLLPENLRTHAGIGTDVVLVGVAERAEIWAKDRWEAFEDDHDGEFDDLDVVLVGDGGAPASAGEE